MTDEHQKNPWVEIGAVWRKNDLADGRVLFTGTMGGAELIIVGNDKRGNDKAPDLRVCVAKRRERDGKDRPKAGASDTGTALDYGSARGSPAAPERTIEDRDAPF